jgi:hypothetical protein
MMNLDVCSVALESTTVEAIAVTIFGVHQGGTFDGIKDILAEDRRDQGPGRPSWALVPLFLCSALMGATFGMATILEQIVARWRRFLKSLYCSYHCKMMISSMQ